MRERERIARGIDRLIVGIEQCELGGLDWDALRLPVLRHEQRHAMTTERRPRRLQPERCGQLAGAKRERHARDCAVANQPQAAQRSDADVAARAATDYHFEQIIAGLSPLAARRAAEELEANGGWAVRRLVRTGNFELTETHFHWIDQFQVRLSHDIPPSG